MTKKKFGLDPVETNTATARLALLLQFQAPLPLLLVFLRDVLLPHTQS